MFSVTCLHLSEVTLWPKRQKWREREREKERGKERKRERERVRERVRERERGWAQRRGARPFSAKSPSCMMCMFCCSVSRSLLQCICKDFFSLAYITLAREERIKEEGWASDQRKSDMQRSCKPPQGERSAAERGRSLQGPLRVCDVHVLLFNFQVTLFTSAMHLHRFLDTGLASTTLERDGWTSDQTKSDVQRSCKPLQGERSAAERGRSL